MSEDVVRALLAEVAEDPAARTLPPETPLFAGGLGLGSVAGAALLEGVRRRLGVDVAAEDLNLDSLETIGSLCEYVARAAAAETPA